MCNPESNPFNFGLNRCIHNILMTNYVWTVSVEYICHNDYIFQFTILTLCMFFRLLLITYFEPVFQLTIFIMKMKILMYFMLVIRNQYSVKIIACWLFIWYVHAYNRGCLTTRVSQFPFFDVDFSILTASCTILLFKLRLVLKNELIVIPKSFRFEMKVTSFHIHSLIANWYFSDRKTSACGLIHSCRSTKVLKTFVIPVVLIASRNLLSFPLGLEWVFWVHFSSYIRTKSDSTRCQDHERSYT